VRVACVLNSCHSLFLPAKESESHILDATPLCNSHEVNTKAKEEAIESAVRSFHKNKQASQLRQPTEIRGRVDVRI